MRQIETSPQPRTPTKKDTNQEGPQPRRTPTKKDPNQKGRQPRRTPRANGLAFYVLNANQPKEDTSDSGDFSFLRPRGPGPPFSEVAHSMKPKPFSAKKVFTSPGEAGKTEKKVGSPQREPKKHGQDDSEGLGIVFKWYFVLAMFLALRFLLPNMGKAFLIQKE